MADEKLEVVITADDRASGVFGGLSGVLGGLGSMILGGLAAAAAAAGAAMFGLGVVLKDSVGEAMESQNAISQLEAVLKSTEAVLKNVHRTCKGLTGRNCGTTKLFL